MNKYALTTLASIPRAGGQASSLPAEVGKPDIMKEGEKRLNALGYQVKDGQIERTTAPFVIVTLGAVDGDSFGGGSRFGQPIILGAGGCGSVQMKAPYFDWEAETPLPAIDLGFVGGTNADENQG